jgi:hypothetical protein
MAIIHGDVVCDLCGKLMSAADGDEDPGRLCERCEKIRAEVNRRRNVSHDRQRRAADPEDEFLYLSIEPTVKRADRVWYSLMDCRLVDVSVTDARGASAPVRAARLAVSLPVARWLSILLEEMETPDARRKLA